MAAMNAPVDLLIASRRGPTGHGGLAQYQRGLARVFQEDDIKVLMAAGEEDPFAPQAEPPPAPLVLPERPPLRQQRLWMRMASRPLLHGLLQPWIVRAYAPWVRVLASHRPRGIHFVGCGWDFVGFALHALAARLGVRFTIWPAVHPGSWGDDRIDLRLYALADRVFCQSTGERDHLTQRGLDPARTLRCGLPPMCPANGDGGRLRRRLQMGERPCGFFLGRRDAEKGYPALLEAWKIVLQSHPRALLLLAGVGDANLPEDLPADSVRDLGTPDEATKADAFAACDFFCLPSAQESFGIVYPEAWSYGKPVLCGPAPASREWIENEKTGLWVDQSPTGIARAIVRLLEDPDLRHRLGEAGRAHQSRHLTWPIVEKIHRQGFGWDGKDSPQNQ